MIGLVGWLLRPAGPDGDTVAGTGSTEMTSTTTSSTSPPSTAAPSTTATTTPPVPTGAFVVAPGGTDVVGSAGPVRTYTVEVEEGLGVDAAAFAAAVDATLADPRSWIGRGDVRLQRVGPGGAASFHVRLATPATVDERCAPLDTAGIYSCRNGADVMLNLDRWARGAGPAQMPLADYRHYMVNHEVGHALGHDHEPCPAPGAVAPVMLQQTKGLDGCRPNPWAEPT